MYARDDLSSWIKYPSEFSNVSITSFNDGDVICDPDLNNLQAAQFTPASAKGLWEIDAPGAVINGSTSISASIKKLNSGNNKITWTVTNENKDNNETTVNDAFVWKIPKPNSRKENSGILFYQKWHQGRLKDLVLHNKGDYFATLSKNSQGKTQVFIHSLTKMSHQVPISHIKGNVNAMSFHPNKPYFIVGTNSNIFLYNGRCAFTCFDLFAIEDNCSLIIL